MIWLRACFRCGGALTDDWDRFGYFVVCLGCGYYLKDAEVARLRNHFSKVPRTAVRSPVGTGASNSISSPRQKAHS